MNNAKFTNWSNISLTHERKYYSAGSGPLAMRVNGVLYFILGDHLGSTSISTHANGQLHSETKYMPYGETRLATGQSPTDIGFTGQRAVVGIGLMFYNARWYDASLGRFVEADTILPGAGNPLAFDRYMYVFGNPLRYSDPSGHFTEEDIPLLCQGCKTWDDVAKYYQDDLILSLLMNPLINFGSVALAGNIQGVINRYGFFLSGNEKGAFGLLLINLDTGNGATFAEILGHDNVTIWSTNTEVGAGGYFFTNWDKGFLDEVSAKTWARPGLSGVDDFIKAGSKYNNHYPRTGPRKYYNLNGRFLYDVATFWDNPKSVYDLALLGIDATLLAVDLSDNQMYDGVYPMMYTGPAWIHSSQYIDSHFYSVAHPAKR